MSSLQLKIYLFYNWKSKLIELNLLLSLNFNVRNIDFIFCILIILPGQENNLNLQKNKDQSSLNKVNLLKYKRLSGFPITKDDV